MDARISNIYKLLTCNVNRSNVALKNTNSQLNKLITLISKEESPRIATVSKSNPSSNRPEV